MVKYPKIGIKFVKNRVKLEIGVKTDSLTVLVLHILPKLMILVSGIWFQVSSILHSIIRLQISLSQIPTLHILPLKNYGLYFGARSKLIHFLWKCAHNRIRMWQELFFFFFSYSSPSYQNCSKYLLRNYRGFKETIMGLN